MTWTVETGNRRRRFASVGFALLELVIVLMLISIVASATILSLRVPLQRARMDRTLDSMEDADRFARNEAQKLDETVELTIDVVKGLASNVSSVGQSGKPSRRSLAFSGGLHIDRFLRSHGGGQSLGELGELATIRITPSGQSETYAVRVKTDRKDRRSPHSWLVVVGATGQYIRTTEDSVVETIVQR